MLKTSGDPATLTHTPPAPPGFPLCNSLDLCGFCTSYSHSHSHMIFIPFSCRSQLNKLSILVYFSCDANKIKDCFLFLVFGFCCCCRRRRQNENTNTLHSASHKQIDSQSGCSCCCCCCLSDIFACFAAVVCFPGPWAVAVCHFAVV